MNKINVHIPWLGLLLVAYALLFGGCTASSPNPVNVEVEEGETQTYRYLAIGQSNMALSLDFSGQEDHGAGVVMSPTADRRSVANVGGVPAVPAYTAIELARVMGEEVTVYPFAISGLSLGCWRDGGACWTQRIEPVRGVGFDGVLLWHGESDAAELTSGKAYEQSLAALIEELRLALGSDALPIYMVGLQNVVGSEEIQNAYARVRAAQARVTETMPNVFLVPTLDITNGDIHPTYAYPEVGKRLANVILDNLEGGSTIVNGVKP